MPKITIPAFRCPAFLSGVFGIRLNRYTRFPVLIFFALIFPLAGCTLNSGKPNTVPTADKWPIYEDAQAKHYIDDCWRQYLSAMNALRELEEGAPATPADILQGVNRLDMLTYEPSGRASLYANTHPNEFVRRASEICEQKFMDLISEMRLSRPLYDRLRAINLAELSPLDRAFADKTLELFQLAGVQLDEAGRARARELNALILKTGQEFSANIRNDVRKLELAPSDLEGLPNDFVAAHPPNEHGEVVIGTDYPDYLPFMQYATSDTARKRLYILFRQRGYPANKVVLQRLLALRHELATLLGFAHFADYITTDKMIGSADTVREFIEALDRIAKQRSDPDYAHLLRRLRKINPAADYVGDWQKPFLESLIRAEDYAVDQQAVRQYFSYAKVKQGIFGLVEDLFGVQIVAWQTDVWHPSVEAYELRERGRVIGRFYLDMHPRPGKYQHAAHFGIREGVQGIQTPEAALVCNFPGGEGGSDFLEHDQAETFLHEFGHLLHTIFGGNLPWMALAGTNTQRDFVEAPSLMLEEWVWDAATLKSFATNPAGQVIPADLVGKMNRARNFGKGVFVRHQNYYSALSLNLHGGDPAGMDLDRLMIDLQNAYSPFAYVDDTYLYASFGHLEGYSAMYYTYMWSAVIATDMFSEFKRHGLRDHVVARRYRERVLAPGASRPAAELVENFLGRPFSLKAFAESLGSESLR